jgi:hypothetical protein
VTGLAAGFSPARAIARRTASVASSGRRTAVAADRSPAVGDGGPPPGPAVPAAAPRSSSPAAAGPSVSRAQPGRGHGTGGAGHRPVVVAGLHDHGHRAARLLIERSICQSRTEAAYQDRLPDRQTRAVTFVLSRRRRSVATLTLNNPAERNTLTA